MLIEALAAMGRWLNEYWAAVVIPFVGALHSHLKSYEAKNVEMPWRWHLSSYFAKVIYAIVSVFITWQICTAFEVRTQITLVTMAVMAVYPDFLLEYVRDAIKSAADKWRSRV